MARCVTPNFTTTSTIYSTFQLFWLLVLLSSSLATELLSAVQTVCPVRRPRHDTDTHTRSRTRKCVWQNLTTAKQRPCQKHPHDNGLYRTRPGRQASARKKHCEHACKQGSKARASMRTCTQQSVSDTRSAAGSKCRAGCGGRGRCAHLAALDEENKDVVVVARLKECHAS